MSWFGKSSQPSSGKKKRERRADFGRTKNWKKAFVKLADGEAIEFV